MSARIIDGWLVVPYSGHDMASVYLNVGGEWKPAFLDWHNGKRVAKVRFPATASRSSSVVIRINDAESTIGRISA